MGWFSFIPTSFADETTPNFKTVNSSWDSIRMVMWVIFCLILIIGLFFLIIKMVAQKNKMMMSGRSIKTIGGVSLGQNKSVQVVEIGHSLYVVGVGNNIQLISKIDDEDEVEYIRDHIQSRGTNEFPAFQSIGKWFKGLRNQQIIEEEDLSNSFQHVFQEKMERISNRKQRVDELFQNDNDDDRLNDK
jgi:flagellar protein FliO/FliZ